MPQICPHSTITGSEGTRRTSNGTNFPMQKCLRGTKQLRLEFWPVAFEDGPNINETYGSVPLEYERSLNKFRLELAQN
jgi:hypothetical protein